MFRYIITLQVFTKLSKYGIMDKNKKRSYYETIIKQKKSTFKRSNKVENKYNNN